MTTLSNIRDIEARLHSHFLDWDDKPLQNELLWMLDEMQELHGKLDTCDVPSVDSHGIDMTLLQRLNWLITHIPLRTKLLQQRGVVLPQTSTSSPRAGYSSPA